MIRWSVDRLHVFNKEENNSAKSFAFIQYLIQQTILLKTSYERLWFWLVLIMQELTGMIKLLFRAQKDQ